MDNHIVHKELSDRVIGLALEVHRTLGPGLLESAYEEDDATPWHRWEFCCAKLHATLRSQPVLPFERQKVYPLEYKGDYISSYISDLVCRLQFRFSPFKYGKNRNCLAESKSFHLPRAKEAFRFCVVRVSAGVKTLADTISSLSPLKSFVCAVVYEKFKTPAQL